MNEGEDLSAQTEAPLLLWESPEYVDYSRGLGWSLAAGLVLLGVIGYSIYRQDWYMAILTVVLGVFLFWYQTKKPGMATFKASQLGIYINEKFYPYSEIHSFWLNVKNEPKKLNIIFRKTYLPELAVLFENIDPVTIRTTLSKYIPEQTDKTESAVDKLSRLLRL